MSDKLRTAVQAVIEVYDNSLEQDTHSNLAPHIKALFEAYADYRPPFHPSQLFTKGTTGSFIVNGFQLSFKDGELIDAECSHGIINEALKD